MMWQALQPIFENTCCPRDTDAVDDVEVVDVEEVEDPAAAATAELAVAAATWVVEDVEDVDVVEVVGDVDCAVGAVAEVAGVGGANMRMKAAKLMMSDEKPDAGLAPLEVSVKLVVLSGKLLNWQPGFSSRSCGKRSLVTPISTL